MYGNRNIAVKWENALHSVFLHATVILRFRLAVLNFSKILKLCNDSIKIIVFYLEHRLASIGAMASL